jgi:hypothetical protein
MKTCHSLFATVGNLDYDTYSVSKFTYTTNTLIYKMRHVKCLTVY